MPLHKTLSLLFLAMIAPLTGCSTYRPCSEAGDTKWPNPIKGDKKCYQVRNTEGKYVNHGTYKVVDPKGAILLDGEFDDGEKNGTWTEYGEKGKPKVQKYYEKGVEKTPPSTPKKNPDEEETPRSKQKR